MDLIEIVSVPLIVAVVYWAIELLKAVIKGKACYETVLKFVPCVAAILGGAMGLVVFFCQPELIVADSWFTAIIVGVASGLSATGTNQIFKQLTKNAEDKNG